MQKWESLRLDVHYKDPKDPGMQSIFSSDESWAVFGSLFQ
jgi:hypothetical protein